MPELNVPDLSLFFFGADAGEEGAPGKYQLLLESAKVADASRMTAVWLPERHFQRFGGLYGSPSVIGAVVAVLTKRIRIRAGSVVLPLQNPLRVAEEWSMIDNLSGGRVDLAYASGWHPNDFVLSPGTFETRHTDMAEKADVVDRLWRGDAVQLPNGRGDVVDVRVLPRPLQPKLTTWMTTSSDQGFDIAAERGYNILTANFSQLHDADGLARRIARYRELSLQHHGRPGTVTLMVHTFVGSRDEIEQVVRPAMLHYQLASSQMLKAIPSNEKSQMPERRRSLVQDDAHLAKAAEISTNRILHSKLSFIGTPEECEVRGKELAALGVDELACLIDFGIPYALTIASVERLAKLSNTLH